MTQSALPIPRSLWFLVLAVLFLPALASAKKPTLEDAEDLLRVADYRGARDLYREIARSARDEEIKAEALYQLASVSLIEADYMSSSRTKVLIWKEALASYEEYLKLRPDDGPVLLEYGKLAQDMGQLSEAEDALAQAVYRGFAAAAVRLGELRHIKGDLDGAAEAYRIASEDAPGDATRWYELGFVLYKADRLEEALEALDRAIALDSRHADALYYAGLSRRLLGRVDEAIDNLTDCLHMGGGEEGVARVYHKLALAYIEKDDTNKAVYHFNQALKTIKSDDDSLHATILNNLAWLLCTTKDSGYRTRQNLQLAYKNAEEAVALLHRKNPYHLDTLAEAAFLLGRPGEAKALLEEAVGLAPYEPYLRAQLSRFSQKTLSPSPPSAE